MDGGWRPFREVLEGRITDKSFVVQLWSIHRGCLAGGGCVDERYKSPKEFFDRTYFTAGLREVLGGIARRLARGAEGASDVNPVIILYTGFGGGKSHTLLSIYHMATRPRESLGSARFRRFLEELGLDPGELGIRSAVSVFDGEALDPHRIRAEYGYPNTWTFILGQLLESAGVGDRGLLDRYRDMPPGSEALGELLGIVESSGARPVILVDELPLYIKRLMVSEAGWARREVDGIRVFLQSLATAVANSRYAVLAVTAPQQYEEEARIVLSALEGVRRVAGTRSIVERRDAAEILKAALIEEYSRDTASSVADQYYGLYTRNRESVMGEAILVSYKERLRASYPFHPLLVDILYGEVAQAPGYQGTRDILRLTAWVLYWRARSGDTRDLVLPGDVNATSRSILDEMLNKSDELRRLRNAVSYDVQVLELMDEEYASKGMPRLPSMTYSAILLRSVAGKPSSPGEVAVGASTPIRGVEPSHVRFMADDLVTKTAHLHKVDQGPEPMYIVKSRANIYVLIERYARDILDRELDEVARRLRQAVSRYWVSTGEARVIVWPLHPGEVPDDDKVKLVLMDPFRHAEDRARLEGDARRIVEYSQPGTAAAYRVHRNTVIIVEPEAPVYRKLRDNMARLMAVERLMEQETASSLGLDEEDLRELREEGRRISSRIYSDVPGLYITIRYPQDSGPSGEVKLGRAQIRAKDVTRGGWEAVKRVLKEAGKLVEDVDKDYIYMVITEIHRNLGKPVTLDDVAGHFTQNPGSPILVRPRDKIRSKIEALAREGRLLVIEGSDAKCMTAPRSVDDAKLLPCTSEEARERCRVEEKDRKPVCIPKPPENCPDPEWIDQHKTWRCRASEEAQEPRMEAPKATTAMAVAGIQLRRIPLTELRARLEENPEMRIRRVNLLLEIQDVSKDKMRGIKLLAKSVTHLSGMPGAGARVEVRAKIEMGEGEATLSASMSGMERIVKMLEALLGWGSIRDMMISVRVTFSGAPATARDLLDALPDGRILEMSNIVLDTVYIEPG